MKRLLAALSVGCALTVHGQAPRPAWLNELWEMGYLMLHLSNINVVNGLNLTRDQALALRGLAREVEAVALKPPSLAGPVSAEMAEVRADWLEVRAILLNGEDVPEALAQRVHTGRAAESRIIRAGLLSTPAVYDTRCASCHVAPTRDVRTAGGEPMKLLGRQKVLADRGHMEAVYGKRGLMELALVADRVNATLTGGQRAILGSFACCLVPPQSLSDPVRIGQAEQSDQAIDLLRRVRRCPDGLWPFMRMGILAKMDELALAVKPGSSDARREQAQERVGAAVERARALPGVEFELEKGKLATAVTRAIVPEPGESKYKAAYFLLVPGASDVYAQYLRRLDREECWIRRWMLRRNGRPVRAAVEPDAAGEDKRGMASR